MEYGRNIGGIKLFGWTGMDMHECAWIDEDGYGGIWTSVDGCEYIWKDMHKYGWTLANAFSKNYKKESSTAP